MQIQFVSARRPNDKMHPISIFLLGIAMSTDAFAAAVGKGAAMDRPRFPDALRAGLIFGVIEGLTPVMGWLLGQAAAKYVTAWDHWIAFTVLGILGLHMIYAGLKPESPPSEETAENAQSAASGAMDVPRRGHGFWSLAATGIATSIDAMAVGVGLAFLEVNIAVVALVIGLTTLVAVTAGIMLGRVLGSLAGKRAEIIGGCMLIVIGSVILYEHLSA